MHEQEFQGLIELFRKADSLPQLPESAIRLIELFDSGDPSCLQIRNAIASDPALSANLLRVASNAAYISLGGPVTSLEAAIMRLGFRTIRTIAVTSGVRALMYRKSASLYFEPERFARHSLFVACAASEMYRQNRPGDCIWSVEEMFAAGLLHDLATCLLAHVTPSLFDSLWQDARRIRITLGQAFEQKFGEPIAMLSCAAAGAWKLPPTLCMAAAFLWQRPEDFRESLCADALTSAEAEANRHGYSIEEWPMPSESEILNDENLEVIEDQFSKLAADYIIAA